MTSSNEKLCDEAHVPPLIHLVSRSAQIASRSPSDLCPICIEPLNQHAFQPICDSGHLLHFSCLQKLFFSRAHKKCPTCRQSIPTPFRTTNPPSETTSASTTFFEASTGRKLSTEYADGRVHHFEGEAGVERKVRVEFPSGHIRRFLGESGSERKVSVEFPSGQIQYFEGERGAERLVRGVTPSGQTHRFAGAASEEHLIRIEFPNGDVQIYEGGRGFEHKVRDEFTDGTVQVYAGERGGERLVRIEDPKRGEVRFFDQSERLVRIRYANGETVYVATDERDEAYYENEPRTEERPRRRAVLRHRETDAQPLGCALL
jgi:uncharacterized protein (DUF1330 family)